MGINNSNDVNYYLNKLIDYEFGNGQIPVIGSLTTEVSAGGGSFFYAIKADGAANLVLSALKDKGGAVIATSGNVTILAGDVLFIPCSSFTAVSGKYIAYKRPINDNP